MAPLPAARADAALWPDWDVAAQPWLPDPAALARPRWQGPLTVCGMASHPPAHEAANRVLPPLGPVSACSMPAAVTLPTHNAGSLMHLQMNTAALGSAGISGCEHGRYHGRTASGLTAGLRGSAAPQPASGDAWQAQPASARSPATTARRDLRPEVSSAGDGLPACDAEQLGAGHRLTHQPSFAAWVPPGRLPGCETPLGMPAAGDGLPFCHGPPSMHHASSGQALTANHSGSLGVHPAQRGSQDMQTAVASQPQVGQPPRRIEEPSFSQQACQQMLQRQAGEGVLLPPSGASVIGYEDSLCAFLGGWQRYGPVQQHKSGRGNRSEPRHAAGPASIYGLVPDFAAGGRPLAEVPGSSELQHPHAADEMPAAAAQAVLPQQARAAVPAQVDPAPLGALPAAAHTAAAAAEKLGAQSEPRTRPSQPEVPAAAAAELLMHAEGEDFWLGLLSVVKDYEGVGRRGKGRSRFATD